jgi:hypothetical protein
VTFGKNELQPFWSNSVSSCVMITVQSACILQLFLNYILNIDIHQRSVIRERIEFALSGTKVYLSKARAVSCVETMVTSVGVKDENGNIAILISMFAV